MSRALGLDVGGTNIKLAVLEDGVLAATDSAATLSDHGGPQAVLERVVALGRAAGPVDSIGVALPGLLDVEGNAVILPNLHGDWPGRPIRAPLEAGFDRPVPLINDGHAFALAEARIGAARGSRDVICIVCGTGVGGGLVLGGELHFGVGDRAGEVGHHTVVPDGLLCACGNHGCLETVAGARAIAREAGKVSFDDVVAAARAGEGGAISALERAGAFIGIAIANLTIFVTPERVVVGGGVAEAGPLLLDPIRAEVERRAANVAPLDRIEIVPAELGPWAGAIGAALWGAES
ncbi:MAG: ROK family protein [Gaiellaceae bacterium]